MSETAGLDRVLSNGLGTCIRGVYPAHSASVSSLAETHLDNGRAETP